MYCGENQIKKYLRTRKKIERSQRDDLDRQSVALLLMLLLQSQRLSFSSN